MVTSPAFARRFAAFARQADTPGVLEVVPLFHESAVDRWQQTSLIGVLLRVRSPQAGPVLRDIMLHDSDPALQAQTALSLGHSGDRASSEALGRSRSTALTEVVTESLGLIPASPLSTASSTPPLP
jgi:hypothetical protein